MESAWWCRGDAGGNALVPDLTLRYPYRQVEFRGGEPIPVDTAASGRGLPVAGGIRIAPAGLVVLAVAALYPILWLALPRRRRRHGSIIMIVLAIGFLTMFGALAKRDWETVHAWTSSQCTHPRQARARRDIRIARGSPTNAAQ